MCLNIVDVGWGLSETDTTTFCLEIKISWPGQGAKKVNAHKKVMIQKRHMGYILSCKDNTLLVKLNLNQLDAFLYIIVK